MRIAALTLFVSLCLPLAAQQRVDARNTYERVLAVVPMVGSGTSADPARPDYAPLPPQPGAAPSRDGIIAFSYVVSDDGTLGLAEFVAVSRSVFKDLLADTRPQVKVFLKGRDSLQDALAEFQKHKKGFNFSQIGAIVP